MRWLALALLLAATPANAQMPLGGAVERLFGPQDKAEREAPSDTRDILRGFTPEIERLSPITGAQIKRTYPGRTLKGLYFQPFLAEQRFVESFAAEGRTTDYTEGDHRETGDWFVRGDVLCYAYAQADPGNQHCFREYSYGDCLISYPASLPMRDSGLPLFPAMWNSISVFAEDGFEWPEGGEAEVFRCEALMS